MKKHIDIYTDGACSGNPGPGGWGVILRYGAHEKELSGGEKNTTNNKTQSRLYIQFYQLFTLCHVHCSTGTSKTN